MKIEELVIGKEYTMIINYGERQAVLYCGLNHYGTPVVELVEITTIGGISGIQPFGWTSQASGSYWGYAGIEHGMGEVEFIKPIRYIKKYKFV